MRKFSGSPFATSPFFLVFQKVPTWLQELWNLQSKWPYFFKYYFKGSGAYMLKILQDIGNNLCVANEGQLLSKGI